jgi:DNA-binding transcriptional LysR family regulator
MLSTPRGTLKVNVPVSFGVLHVTPALAGLLGAYPELNVDMTFNDREVHLAEEGYDVSLVIAAEPRGTLVARKLAPIRYALCAAPSYLRRHGLPASVEDLARHKCIVFGGSGNSRQWHFDRDEAHASVEVSGSLRLDNENAVRRAALAGCGIALLPTYMVGDDLRDDALRVVLPGCRATQTSLYATYLPNRYVTAKVRVFVDYLVAQFGPSPQWDAEAKMQPEAKRAQAPLHAGLEGTRQPPQRTA